MSALCKFAKWCSLWYAYFVVLTTVTSHIYASFWGFRVRNICFVYNIISVIWVDKLGRSLTTSLSFLLPYKYKSHIKMWWPHITFYEWLLAILKQYSLSNSWLWGLITALFTSQFSFIYGVDFSASHQYFFAACAKF